MKRNLILGWIAAGLLVGCDYDVKLAEKPSRPMDTALIGMWEQQGTPKGEETKYLQILPLSKNEYVFLHYDVPEEGVFPFRAWRCEAAGFTFIQHTWPYREIDNEPDDYIGAYMYNTCQIVGDKLIIRQLNKNVVGSRKEITTPAALIAAIEANRDNPELFREESVFTRAKIPPQIIANDALQKRPAFPGATLLVGRDYKAALTEKSEMPQEFFLDKGIIEVLFSSLLQNGGGRLQVLPFSKCEFLIRPSGTMMDGRILIARARICKVADLRFVQLAWIDPAHAYEFDDATGDCKYVYQYITCRIEDGKLVVRHLNTDIVSRDVTTSAALRAAIESNIANPELFREEQVFTRVEPPPDADTDATPTQQDSTRPPLPAGW